MRQAVAVIGLAACLLPAAARGDEPAPGSDRLAGTLSILFENDVFFNTDRDYTNGVLIGYTLAAGDTPGWLSDAIHMLPRFKDRTLHLSAELGQNIYTPTDLTLVNPPLSERPYAGFLYAGLGVIADDAQDHDQLQFQLGVVGPDSLAEATQKLVHSTFGFQKPMGWATQLANEPALEITYEHSRDFNPWRGDGGLSADFTPHAGGGIGNVYDYVNAGAMARVGFNMPEDYGPVRIDPSLPGSSYFGVPSGGARWTLYAFGGVDGRVMGHNIFLDGNSFQHSRSVAKNVLVGDAQFGITFAYDWFKLSLTHVFRTKEYHTQPGVDQFGAINVSFRL